MSSFKEVKRREKIKAWDGKARRLYAYENLTDDDRKFLNIQYDYNKMRQTNSYVWGMATAALLYRFPIIYELHLVKRLFLCCGIGYIVYRELRAKNRAHYEALLHPYFEKYYIK